MVLAVLACLFIAGSFSLLEKAANTPNHSTARNMYGLLALGLLATGGIVLALQLGKLLRHFY